MPLLLSPLVLKRADLPASDLAPLSPSASPMPEPPPHNKRQGWLTFEPVVEVTRKATPPSASASPSSMAPLSSHPEEIHSNHQGLDPSAATTSPPVSLPTCVAQPMVQVVLLH